VRGSDVFVDVVRFDLREVLFPLEVAGSVTGSRSSAVVVDDDCVQAGFGESAYEGSAIGMGAANVGQNDDADVAKSFREGFHR